MAYGRMISRVAGHDKGLAEFGKKYGPWGLVLHHRIIAFVDKNKNVQADPYFLKSNLFYHDSDVNPEQCRLFVAGLTEFGLAKAYQQDGVVYLHFPKFDKHQKNWRPEREAAEYPEPSTDAWLDLCNPDNERQLSAIMPDNERNHSGSSPREENIEEKRREENKQLDGSTPSTLRKIAGNAKGTAEEFVKRWNEEICAKFPAIRRVSKLTPEREKVLLSRLKEETFTIENVDSAFADSPQARGEPWPGKQDSWTADFDWVIGMPLRKGGKDRPENWLKLFERKYRATQNGGEDDEIAAIDAIA